MSVFEDLLAIAPVKRNRNAFKLPDEVIEVMYKCALRFDGWSWLAWSRGCADGAFEICPETFRPHIDPIIQDLRLYPDEAANHAAFFILQRVLCKQQDYVVVPQSDRTHTAFRFLFLHLYLREAPTKFALPQESWERLSLERKHQYAAMVRGALLCTSLQDRQSAYEIFKD